MKRRAAHVAKPLLAVFLLVLCFGWLSGALAETSYTVQVTGTYGQTEARKMLSMINSFRTGGDAWYWNSDNASKTVCTGLKPLSYDYTLERTAMTRAMEIALSFSHTRPNGQSCMTAFTGSYNYRGENIAAGNSSAERTFIQWREDDDDYSGQGHRRNMLDKNFTAVGIAHVEVDGCDYWVQEFANASSIDTNQTSANDSRSMASINILASLITQVKPPVDSLSVECDDSVELPANSIRIDTADHWPPGFPLPVGAACSWKSGNSAVATYSSGRVQGVSAGSVMFTATALGQNLSLQVQVRGKDISGATVTLDLANDTAVYDGTPKTPAVRSVVLNGKTLVSGVDYTVSYANNTDPGTAEVRIAGMGKYIGYATKRFTILPNQPTGVSISGPNPLTIAPGATVRLTAVVEPAGMSTTLTWSSSAPAVATVDQSGVVSAQSEGYTQITVRTSNDKSASLSLYVADPTRPTGITLDRTGTVELKIGETLQLHATLQPANAVSDLEWSCSSTAIAEVDGYGKVTPYNSGTTTITVKAARLSASGAEVSASVRVRVTDPYRPTGIHLEESGPVTLALNSTLQLHATLEPADAQSRVNWSSSQESVVWVNDSGLVVARSEGSAIITARAAKLSPDKKEVSTSIEIQVVDPSRPTGIHLQESGPMTLDLDSMLQLHATLEPANAKSGLNWSSSRQDVATVSGSGLVIPRSEGSTTITVKAEKLSPDGREVSASIDLNIIEASDLEPVRPTDIYLDVSGTIQLNLGETRQLKATLEPEGVQSELTWSSSNKKIAKVDDDGWVTPVKEGRAVISVKASRKSAAGKTLSAKVTVQVVDLTRPTGIELNLSGTQTLDYGDTLALTATLEPASAISDLKWSSSNKKIAKVDGNGLVTPVKAGKAVISVKASRKNAAGKTLSAKVTVRVADPYKPTSVSIDQPGPLRVNLGETLTLTATMQPDDARSKLTWSSSNKKIATVKYDAEAGECVVTGKKAGSAKITVKTRNGKKKTISLKVVDPTKATSVSLNYSGTEVLWLDEELELIATMQPATATSKLSWSSSNKKIATVEPATAEDIAEGWALPGSCVVIPWRTGTVTISVKTSTGKKASVKLKIIEEDTSEDDDWLIMSEEPSPEEALIEAPGEGEAEAPEAEELPAEAEELPGEAEALPEEVAAENLAGEEP